MKDMIQGILFLRTAGIRAAIVCSTVLEDSTEKNFIRLITEKSQKEALGKYPSASFLSCAFIKKRHDAVF